MKLKKIPLYPKRCLTATKQSLPSQDSSCQASEIPSCFLNSSKNYSSVYMAGQSTCVSQAEKQLLGCSFTGWGAACVKDTLLLRNTVWKSMQVMGQKPEISTLFKELENICIFTLHLPLPDKPNAAAPLRTLAPKPFLKFNHISVNWWIELTGYKWNPILACLPADAKGVVSEARREEEAPQSGGEKNHLLQIDGKEETIWCPLKKHESKSAFLSGSWVSCLAVSLTTALPCFN